MYSLLIKKKNINQSLTFEVLQIYRSCGEYYSRWSGFAAQKFLMCPPWTSIRHQRLSLEEPIPLSFLGYQEDMVRLVPQYVSSGYGCSRPWIPDGKLKVMVIVPQPAKRIVPSTTVRMEQKSNYQNGYQVHFAFYTLVERSVLNPFRFDGYWGDIESKVRSLYL